MTALVLSLRSSTQHPLRLIAVWAFCVAAIAFWIGLAQYVFGFSMVGAMVIGGLLSLVALPCASRIADVIWLEDADA